MSERPILLVSNRGPISFRTTGSGESVAVRGAGGLVSGLTPLFAGTDRRWLAAALSDDDRAAVAAASGVSTGGHVELSVDGLSAILLAVDAEDLRRSYEVVCNATLWFLHHHLFDLTRRPSFDPTWFDAWAAFERVNAAFATAVADLASPDAVVLVQDYHLSLLGPLVAQRRDDLTTVHFSHTPFAAPEQLAVLPEGPRRTLLTGLAGHTACGFHTERWRTLFEACCVADDISLPDTFVAPLGPDTADLAATLASDACRRARAELTETVGGRAVIARVDRIEPSKNLLRGFQAFDLLLEQHPEWRDQVVFAASVYPSRETDETYVRYHRDVTEVVAEINGRWATDSWTPILLDTSDDHPRSIATLAIADVVLVNPIRDGLNLVATEAMAVNARDALLALSTEAGVWSLLGDVARGVQPFDLCQTAEVLHDLLSTSAGDRAVQAAALRRAAERRRPADWLADQLAAVPPD